MVSQVEAYFKYLSIRNKQLKILNEITDHEKCHVCGTITEMFSSNPDYVPVVMWDGIQGSGNMMGTYCLTCQCKMISLWNSYKK